jgi:hypothetical protein
MARHQILDRPAIVPILGPVSLTADNTPAALDTQGFDNIQVLISTGIQGVTFTGTDKIEWTLKHGDTTTVADHTAVTSSDVQIYNESEAEVALVTGGIVWQLNAAHAAALNRRVDYFGNKRYLSLLADFSGTHGAGTPLHAFLLLSRGHLIPS